MRAIARSEAGPWASAAAVLFLGLALAAPARGQAPEPEVPGEEAAAPLVERVEIARNQFLSAETLRFYISTKPGDRYDQLRLREDFRRLWDTGFVDDLSFDVDDGPKAKVKRVDFVGNQVFSDATLGRHMKNVRLRGLWGLGWLLGKTTYTPDKWSGAEGDQKRLEDFYLDHGYVTASVGEPKVSYIAGKAGKKPTKGIPLQIPGSEGDQYRIG